MRLMAVTNVVLWDMLTEDAKVDLLSRQVERNKKGIVDPAASHMSAEQIVNELVKADPTPNRKYLQFIVNRFLAGNFKLEDVGVVSENIALFDKVKAKLPVANRDINSFKRMAELYIAVRPFKDQDVVSNRQAKSVVKEAGVKKIIDAPAIKIFQVLTEDAAKFYGKGTTWCTAGDNNNQFEHYAANGAIYVIMTEGRKFQLHVEEDQFMDEQDEDVEQDDIDLLSAHPEYATFLNMLIKKHYFGGKNA